MLQYSFPYLKAFLQSASVTACVVGAMAMPSAMASDHNDGPRVIVAENHDGDITDIYSFREGDQSGKPADNDHLVLVMTGNGLLAPQTSRPFNPAMSYEFHVSRGAGNTTEDHTFDFRFGPVETSGAQSIYLQGKFVGTTSTLGKPAITNEFTTPQGTVKVFAGPREDPFFLDLQVIRCGLGCAGGAPKPEDSFGRSNVFAIVMSAPVKLLQAGTQASIFNVWGVTRK